SKLVLLCDVRTCDVQRWLEEIAHEDKTGAGNPLRHSSLERILRVLSGEFSPMVCDKVFSKGSTQRKISAFQKPRGQATLTRTLSRKSVQCWQQYQNPPRLSSGLLLSLEHAPEKS